MSQDKRDIADYCSYLRALQRERHLRQFEFAKLVGRSASWYSQILSGKRRLRPELAEEIADKLRLSTRERLELLSLVESEVGNSRIIRTRAQDLRHGMERPERAEDELYTSLTHWHVGAILELARCEEYVPEASWVGAALRPQITPDEAQAAMDTLRDLDYLDANYRIVRDGEAVTSHRRDLAPGPATNAALEVHDRTLAMARDALPVVPQTDRLFTAATVGLSEKDFQ
ncbi:MAG: TIGR02147 family protein, partial [Myxococcota bacterium]